MTGVKRLKASSVGSELRFEQVRKAFGAHEVLKGLTASIPLTGVTFVVGASGSGKSVVCRLGVGLLRADAGQVTLFDEDLSALPERDLNRLRARVPYLVQGPALLDWLSLEANVALASRQRADGLRLAREALVRLGLGAFGHKLPKQVGPGVAKRAAIARALVLQPECLMLDEPTTGLDSEAAAQVTDTIAQLRREGLAAIVVSHDYRALERLADRVLEIRDGLSGFEGSPDGFLRHQAASLPRSAPSSEPRYEAELP